MPTTSLAEIAKDMAGMGIVLIKVKASRIAYWKGRDEGEIEL
ncbi:hypothetical protein [Bradyrhizobium sp. RDT46]